MFISGFTVQISIELPDIPTKYLKPKRAPVKQSYKGKVLCNGRNIYLVSILCMEEIVKLESSRLQSILHT